MAVRFARGRPLCFGLDMPTSSQRVSAFVPRDDTRAGASYELQLGSGKGIRNEWVKSLIPYHENRRVGKILRAYHEKLVCISSEFRYKSSIRR